MPEARPRFSWLFGSAYVKKPKVRSKGRKRSFEASERDSSTTSNAPTRDLRPASETSTTLLGVGLSLSCPQSDPDKHAHRVTIQFGTEEQAEAYYCLVFENQFTQHMLLHPTLRTPLRTRQVCLHLPSEIVHILFTPRIDGPIFHFKDTELAREWKDSLLLWEYASGFPEDHYLCLNCKVNTTELEILLQLRIPPVPTTKGAIQVPASAIGSDFSHANERNTTKDRVKSTRDSLTVGNPAEVNEMQAAKRVVPLSTTNEMQTAKRVVPLSTTRH